MRATLKTTVVMGKEFTTIQMETIMTENGKMIRGLVEVVYSKQTVQNSMVSSLRMQLMVKSSTKTKMETSSRLKPHPKRTRLKKRKVSEASVAMQKSQKMKTRSKQVHS